MAGATRRLVAGWLGAAVTAWLWLLAGTLLALRWAAYEHPGPPLRTLFPYGEMRVGVDASYPPFAVATATDLFGLDIELGRAVAARLGVPVRFVNMGYDGLYDSLRADLVDVVISALLIDPARTNDVLYTLPYFNAGLMLVSPADAPVDTMAELSGKALAFEFGSAADQVAQRWLRRIPPFERQPYELPVYALDAARFGQADAALVDAVSARLYLREHPEWRATTAHVTDALYAMAVRINRGATWAAVNDVLSDMVADGTVEALVGRWL